MLNQLDYPHNASKWAINEYTSFKQQSAKEQNGTSVLLPLILQWYEKKIACDRNHDQSCRFIVSRAHQLALARFLTDPDSTVRTFLWVNYTCFTCFKLETIYADCNFEFLSEAEFKIIIRIYRFSDWFSWGIACVFYFLFILCVSEWCYFVN